MEASIPHAILDPSRIHPSLDAFRMDRPTALLATQVAAPTPRSCAGMPTPKSDCVQSALTPIDLWSRYPRSRSYGWSRVGMRKESERGRGRGERGERDEKQLVANHSYSSITLIAWVASGPTLRLKRVLGCLAELCLLPVNSCLA